jgi:DNA-binding NarL/FixJ family response regulator
MRELITILIAATVRLYRDGLASTLKVHERLRIDGPAATSTEMRTDARGLQPDVVLDVAIDPTKRGNRGRLTVATG